MKHLQRWAATAVLLAGALLGSGCTTALVLKHVHDQLTEGDPAPCHRLNSVERALQARCGAFVPGSLNDADVAASGLPVCPLALAARDPRYWPVLPELLVHGATTQNCVEAPLLALAHAQTPSRPCPDFASASPATLQALRTLAEDADGRSVQHDVVRLLSCPQARAAGLDGVLDTWLAQGRLARDGLTFSVLGALHPSHLHSPLSRSLEAQGHVARAAFGGRGGLAPNGFELALQDADLAALDWWLVRVPTLANEVPPTQAGQLPWRPLARVLTPSFIPDAARQQQLVDWLMAHGADPWKRLPHDPWHNVIDHARRLKSPLVAQLESPRAVPAAAVLAAAASAQGQAVSP